MALVGMCFPEGRLLMSLEKVGVTQRGHPVRGGFAMRPCARGFCCSRGCIPEDRLGIVGAGGVVDEPGDVCLALTQPGENTTMECLGSRKCKCAPHGQATQLVEKSE